MKEKSDQLRYSAPAAKALLEMMEFMAKHDHRYTLSEIVESLNITSNSAFRIFKELLEEKGYVDMKTIKSEPLFKIDIKDIKPKQNKRFYEITMKVKERVDYL